MATAPDPFSVAEVTIPRVPSSLSLTVAWAGIGLVSQTVAAMPTPRFGPCPSCAHGARSSSSSNAWRRMPASASSWPLSI